MNATPFPLGPVATGAPVSSINPDRLRAVHQVMDELRRCRTALDMLDLPLPAAHVDMAVQTLKHDFGFDDPQAPSALRDEVPALCPDYWG